MSSTARDLAGAAIGVGVLGVGPVAALIVADEVEHFRCGIGCVLTKESSTGKFIVDSIIAQKSPDSPSDADNRLDEGDAILKIEDTWLHARHSIQEVSSLIRGKEGTAVRLLVLKRDEFQPSIVSIVRRRLPGSKTEMLGALWQTRSAAAPKRPATREDKLEKLEQLRARDLLSPAEYDAARRRILAGADGPAPAPPPPPAQRAPVVARGGELAGLLGDDLQRLMGIHRDQAAAAAATAAARSGGRGAWRGREEVPPRRMAAVVTPAGGAVRLAYGEVATL